MAESASIDFKSKTFWSHFASNYWQKKPTVFPKIDTPLSWVTESEFFDLLREYVDRCYFNPIGLQQTRLPTTIVLTIKGKKIQGDISKYLPNTQDLGLQDYNARMLDLSENNYSLYLTNFFVANFQLWQSQREFVYGLQTCVGLPSAGIGSDVFLGCYPKTSFGVHCDPMEVFYTPISGKKRYRIWDVSYVKEHRELIGKTDYDEHLDDSVVIEGEPGDLIYWPYRSFHIAEGTGEFTVAMGTYFDTRDSIEMVSLNFLNSAMRRAGKIPPLNVAHPDSKLSFDPNDAVESAAKIPEELGRGKQSLVNLIQGPLFRDAEKIFWQKTVSTCGLNVPAPPQKQESLKPEYYIQANPKYPVLGALLEAGNAYLVIVNGHVHQVMPHPNIHALIDYLNKGEKFKVSNLIEQFSGNYEYQGKQLILAPEVVEKILDFIVMARGVKVGKELGC